MLKSRKAGFILGLTFIPALYFLDPSLTISIVDAADYATEPKERSGIEQSTGNPALSAHGTTVQTYLSAAMEYADGLGRQAGADVPLVHKDVKEHFQLHTKGLLENLNNAKAHLGHISHELGRIRQPAAEMKSAREDLSTVRESVDLAIKKAAMLDKRLTDQSFLGNRELVRQEISELKSRIREAVAEQKDVNSKLGV